MAKNGRTTFVESGLFCGKRNFPEVLLTNLWPFLEVFEIVSKYKELKISKYGQFFKH